MFGADRQGARLVKDIAVCPRKLEFKDPSAVVAIGFEPLPLEKVGAYADERRATWPVERVVRPVRLLQDKATP